MSSPQPAHVQVIQMATAFWASRAVYAAARLGLADFLADGPRTAAVLAEATGMHVQSLYRLMRTLASLGLLSSDEARRFALTPLGASLRTGAPGMARPTVLAMAGDWMWQAWSEILHSIETGGTGMEQAWGQPLFEYLEKHPEEAKHFGEAMWGFHESEPPAVAAAYDFTGIRTLIDVGGGIGHLMTAVLAANPELRGILYDLPHVVPEARKHLESKGMAARCEVRAGDFFATVPAGGDAYMLSRVIHDWDEQRCIELLHRCHRAMGPEGRLLLVETVLPPGDAPHPGKLLDLQMLVAPGGMERTANEYAALLAQASFRMTHVVPTASPVSIVEAVPA
jgi:O-methyltransferase domain/Dimerisation domain